jgi:hypothetical protein
MEWDFDESILQNDNAIDDDEMRKYLTSISKTNPFRAVPRKDGKDTRCYKRTRRRSESLSRYKRSTQLRQRKLVDKYPELSFLSFYYLRNTSLNEDQSKHQSLYVMDECNHLRMSANRNFNYNNKLPEEIISSSSTAMMRHINQTHKDKEMFIDIMKWFINGTPISEEKVEKISELMISGMKDEKI